VWLPIETLIKEYQNDYYQALGLSDANSDSTAFIEFMLSVILDTIEAILKTEAKITQKITVNQQKIIQAIKDNPHITQEELAAVVGIARLNIIKNMKKLQEQHIITRVGADKNGYWRIEDS